MSVVMEDTLVADMTPECG